MDPPTSTLHLHVELSVSALGPGWNLHGALAKVASYLRATERLCDCASAAQGAWPGLCHPGGTENIVPHSQTASRCAACTQKAPVLGL